MEAKNYLMPVMAILAFVFISSAVLAAPAYPAHYYGYVTVNGGPAPDGLVIVARIQGVQVSATTTSGGRYGYSPLLYVEDSSGNRAGKTVEFFVDGTKTGQITFVNGDARRIDFSITREVQQATTGGGGGYAVTSNPNPGQLCYEVWQCTDWLDCINGEQKRVCTDSSKCGTTNGKPAETRNCTVAASPKCVEDWSCNDWSSCVAGVESRSCTDLNSCGTNNNKPETIKSCQLDQPVGFTGMVVGNAILYAPFIIIALVGLIIVAAVVRRKR